MEDGKCPIIEKGEGYDSKGVTSAGATSSFRQINGHTVNGVDVVEPKPSGNHINEKLSCKSHSADGLKRGGDNAHFKGIKRRLSDLGKSEKSASKVQKRHSDIAPHFEHKLGSRDGNHKEFSINEHRFDTTRKKHQLPSKFKCEKCKCASFKSFGLLKEHQRECAEVHPKRSSAAAGTQKTASRKVYMCSVCGTYYENWNLFLHMREVHNRHICLFCLGMFSKAERLASHLVAKHSVSENKFSDIKDFFSVYSGSLLLMCCYCDKVHTEKDNFTIHNCVRIPKDTVSSYNLAQSADVRDTIKNSSASHRAVSQRSPNISVSNNCDKVSEIKTNHQLNIAANKTEKKEEPNTIRPLDLKLDTTDYTDHELDDEVRNITKGLSTISPEKTEPLQKYDASVVNEEINNLNHVNDESVKNERSNNNYERPNQPHLNMPLKLRRSSTPVLNKPPKRNRRPPKRYEREDAVPIENGEIFTLSQPSFDYSPQLPIPKLKVKLPAIMLRTESPSDYSSESEDNLAVHEDAGNADNSMHYNDPDISTLHDDADISSPHDDADILAPHDDADISMPHDDADILTTNEDADISAAQNDAEISMDHNDADISMTNDNTNLSSTHSDGNISAGNENDFDEKPDLRNCTQSEPTDVTANLSDIVVASADVPLIELTLDKPLDKYPIQTLLKTFLSATNKHCIYCNHARKIAVNGKQLALHFLSQHRFSATVNSITAEELLPETISTKIKQSLAELETNYLNLETYESDVNTPVTEHDKVFECFQCYYVTAAHKELYMHNRKMHQKPILFCVMCKSAFYSYCELLCHLCPGNYEQTNVELSYRCCFGRCVVMPSAFRLMVHLRRSHNACNVCLERCHDQAKLLNHVWKHKLNHFCYRCGISYRNKADITKHLFWKHGTESVLCKRCLQKKWPHVYHFCSPPNSFVCDECNLSFSTAVMLKVHKRLHSGDFPYVCFEDDCSEKFVSKKLLEKHSHTHREPPGEALEETSTPALPDAASPIRRASPVAETIKEEDSEATAANVVGPVNSKSTKMKRDKKPKEIKDNLLLDVNLPALNLSESDSSEESDVEESKSHTKVAIDLDERDNIKISESDLDEPKKDLDVLQIWDNFNQYQAEVQKKHVEKEITIIKKHVCDSDHDYCLIPTEEGIQPHEPHHKTNDKKKKSKTKKKQQKDGYSSLSDSSSDSDSSCSCGSNCSCSSSSNSSSSGSNSSDSDSSDTADRKKGKKLKNSESRRKGSFSSHTSAVDIMATEDTGPILPAERADPPIPECDLLTDETDTDEDFYDEHPQRIANQLLAEKRSQLIQSAATSPVGNGSLSGAVSPNIIEKSKKKGKPKKKKKAKKSAAIQPPPNPLAQPVQQQIPQNKITISLQKKSVQITDGLVPKMNYNASVAMEMDNKRASKRKRVPNRFYGYSSDEEYAFKPQLPPKLEWRKEDLPSPTPSPSNRTIPAVEPVKTIPPLIIPKPMISRDISSEDSDSSVEGELQICQTQSSEDELETVAPEPPGPFQYPRTIFPKPAGVRPAREGENVYCFCRCPYDEVSEMIGCDGDDCEIEWFHFECVGILVPPKGKWYCPQCEARLNPS